RMDLADMFRKHTESGCGLTIACTTVTRDAASSLGIMAIDKDSKIIDFMEKPGPTKDISDFMIPQELRKDRRSDGKDYLASMGIYIFDAALMERALANDENDFGKEIIPDILSKESVNAYVFDGYWEDIGTIKSFYEANLDLTSIAPQFNFYEEEMPIHTHKRNLPASKLNYCTLNRALTAEGCIITNASISRSIVGVRTTIESGASMDGVVCMGADRYETAEELAENKAKGRPDIGIGSGSIIKGAIIDKNARIGSNCRIGIDPMERKDGDYPTHYVVDGIIVIAKNAVITPGTVI
ncbi:MAG: sugar phosphate nucleotidyltransferase, partial [Spirochaetaceae bacterium]|nr:sugar phosphate nucleotidyltransferase [Spirochaetaceae bacterium]